MSITTSTTNEDSNNNSNHHSLSHLERFEIQSQSQHKRIFDVTEGNRTKKTAVVYQRIFKCFLKHVKVNDLEVLVDFNQKTIKEMIVDYIIHLRDEKKLSRTSIKVHLAAILHFFHINNDDFNLTTRHFRLHLPSDELTYSDDRAYTRNEIAQILRSCDVRSRAMILLLCSSGIRIGALGTLQIGDLTKVENLSMYRIQVYARTRDKYMALCTPECYNAIQDYFRYRQDAKEQLIDKSPLFRECKDQVQTSHGMRKFFMTECEKSGMRSINVKMLLGHDIGVSGHYYRPAESDILQDYMTHASDALTISDEHRLKKQVEKLETEQTQEIARLKAQLEAREEKDRKISEEWQLLKRDMDELRKFVFPGPVPRDKQMRKTYLKVVKSHYKDEKGIDIINTDDEVSSK